MPSVIGINDPLNVALSRTGHILFRHFRLKKWLLFAVPAALMLVGVGFPPSLNLAIQIGVRALPKMSLDDFLNWYQAHNVAIPVTVLSVVTFVILPLYLLCRWINGRAYMVFFDQVVNNESRLKSSWQEHRDIGNSLMKMIITWELVVFNLWLGALVIAGLFTIPDIRHFLETGNFQPSGWTIAAVIIFLVEAFLVTLSTIAVSCFLYLLAVPVMYIRRVKARPAIKLAWSELFLPNKGACLLYFLLNFVAGILKGSITAVGLVILGVVTLACACVMLYLPIVGNYPLGLAGLPVTTFEAIFRLSFVSQFGPEYAVPWKEIVKQEGFPVILANAPATEGPAIG